MNDDDNIYHEFESYLQYCNKIIITLVFLLILL